MRENDPADIVRYAEDIASEAHEARFQDANLARFREEAPDAVRAFGDLTFTEALVSPQLYQRLGTALEDYAAAKHAEDRMDRYGRLFLGTAGFDPTRWGITETA
ncbi:hypothetical protein CTZ27_30125 [Streptomyces griseocarneus]|nr:hypothetical protein CTZ27_30125 [Streptomyces griseocarneus]